MKQAAVLLLCSLLLVSSTPLATRYLGNFTTPNPSFLSIEPKVLSSGSDLIITSFAAFGSGAFRVVPDIGSMLSNVGSIQPTDVDTSLNWPNSVTVAPSGMFTGCDVAFIVADGFLVPGKSNGAVFVLCKNSTDGEYHTLTLTTTKSGYFYHFTHVLDVNQDGRLDILTARVNKPIFGSSNGELVWLQANEDPTQPWNETVVAKGPDVDFIVAELDGNANTLEIIAAQFFSNELSLTILDATTGSQIFQRSIDSSIGPAYSVELADLNNDGQKELLVTNHDGTSSATGVWAYEIPSDLKAGNFTRFTLDSGFPVAFGFNSAAPGYAYSFHPSTKSTADKASILIAGDGANRAYYLSPDTADFSYIQTELLNVGGTVGSLAFGDVNGDGWTEVFVPHYEKGIIHVFTFAP